MGAAHVGAGDFMPSKHADERALFQIIYDGQRRRSFFTNNSRARSSVSSGASGRTSVRMRSSARINGFKAGSVEA